MKGVRGIGAHVNMDPYWLSETLQRIELKIDTLGERQYGRVQWQRIVDEVQRRKNQEEDAQQKDTGEYKRRMPDGD